MQFYNFLRIACMVTLCLSVIVLVILTLIAFRTYPPFKELFKKVEDIKKEARPFLEEFNKLEDLKNEGKEYDESRYKVLLEKLQFFQDEIHDCNEMIENKKIMIKYTSGFFVAVVVVGAVFAIFVN